MKQNIINSDKFFFICIFGEDNKPVIYQSEKFRLSELDILSLIKLCIKEERNKTVGRKILEVYKDATNFEEQTNEKLKMMGLSDEEFKPIKTKNATIR